ncbi:MAG: tRNA (5-methylaminomethyl-2-thiouridine)(34)-methyltransferase MnmD [Flavobacteriaceae bacterium]
MRRNIITTSDGSKTIQLVDWNEQYHSVHGALAEAQHVFLKNGLAHRIQTDDILEGDKRHLHIVEMGLGTGLNLLLTYDFLTRERLDLEVTYTGIDKFPISYEEQSQLDYEKYADSLNTSSFSAMCKQTWNTKAMYSGGFSLEKKQTDLLVYIDNEPIDLIYFDAFGPRVQPELWTEESLNVLVSKMNINAVFVTYCAKGVVRRSLQNLGLRVERLPGPPGKREMLRGVKEN